MEQQRVGYDLLTGQTAEIALQSSVRGSHSTVAEAHVLKSDLLKIKWCMTLAVVLDISESVSSSIW